MPVIRKNETLPVKPVIIFLYGDPGVSKTSLANTSKNPILLDFDRGVQRSYGRPDALVFEEGWREVDREEQAGTFNGYDTVVVDTAKGALDDFLMEYVISLDIKLRTNKLKAYGAIGDEFKLFVNKRRTQGADIVVIAHAKYEKDGDNTKITPDVTGGSLNLLLRIADQVGFITVENGKRTILFDPTDKTIGKNVAGLPKLTFPHFETPEWTGFMDREIIQKVKDAIGKQTEEQRIALETLSEWYGKIDKVKASDKDLKAISKELGAVTEPHISKQLKSYFRQHLIKLNWEYSKEEEAFKEVVKDDVAA